MEHLRKDFRIVATVYSVISIFLLLYLKFYADNPDTFQYMNIAGKYASFDFANAVNGYWSPLVSWLLIVPIAMLGDSIEVFKYLQILIGLFVLYQWSRYIAKVNLSLSIQRLLLIIAVPFIISWGLLNCTPDLLFVGILLWIMNIFQKGRVDTDPALVRLAGIAGGLLYLSKAFGLPLFIVLSAGILLYEKHRGENFKKCVVQMYSVFGVICLFWVLVISFHYGELTINKSASFNRSLDYEMLTGKKKLPILGDGLIKPLPGQNSAWESPGEYVSETGPSTPLRTGSGTKASFTDKFSRNIKSIYYFDFRRQTGALFIILLILVLYKLRKEILKEKWLFISLLTLVAIYGGYSLILVHTRYIWACTLLMLLMSLFFAVQIFKNRFFRALSILLIMAVSLKRPVKEILFSKDNDVSPDQLLTAILHPFSTMESTYWFENDLRKFIKELKDLEPGPGNLASNGNPEDRDGYATSLHVASVMHSNYYGQVGVETFRNKSVEPGISDRQMTNQDLGLRGEIQYILTFESASLNDSLLLESQSGVKLYKLSHGIIP